MLDLRFVGEDTVYKVKRFANISDHVVRCGELGVTSTNGFTLSREDKEDNWDYTKFTTVYDRVGDDIYFSDDGSVKPIPEPPVNEEEIPEEVQEEEA